MKETVFFGDSGITSTEANHLANIASEKIKFYQEKIDNITFVDITLESLNTDKSLVVQKGTKNISQISEYLSEIAQLNSFIAWVREAIKKKEELQSKINRYDFLTYCVERDITLVKPQRPDCKKIIDFNHYLDEYFDTTKRCRYYTIEAFAATVGKYIHPNGKFSNARNELLKRSQKTSEKTVSPDGNNVFLETYKASMSEEEVNSEFFELQKMHREYEKELNSLKAEINDGVNSCNINFANEYQKALVEYDKTYSEWDSRYRSVMSEFNNWQTKECERIAKLKIIIPPLLNYTFNALKKG